MNVKRQSLIIILKLLLFAMTTAGLAYVIFARMHIIYPLIMLVLLGIEIISFVNFYNSQNRKLTYFFDAIRNEDTSLKFPENAGSHSLNSLHSSLNNLNKMISEIKIKNETNERFYKELIEHSTTGLMSFDEDGYVEVLNNAAKRFLGVVLIANISLLRQKNPGLYDIISALKSGEKKTLKTIVGNELVTLSIQSSELIFGEKKFKLISFQDIRHELEENEIDSWQKLIRVMTHEIMNSIAPITSLTNTLLKFYRSEGLPKKPDELSSSIISDTIEGLSVIEERGKGLIHFVDNYRKLAKVPVPTFSKLELKPWIHGLSLLFQPEFNEKNICFSANIDKSLTSIITDEKLLNQILINLFMNSIDAVSSKTMEESRNISLSINNSVNNVVRFELSDNGVGIDESILDKIFVPFFTTKEGGNGIGLSLSRQITKKLNGKLTVHSVKGLGSKFVLEI